MTIYSLFVSICLLLINPSFVINFKLKIINVLFKRYFNKCVEKFNCNKNVIKFLFYKKLNFEKKYEDNLKIDKNLIKSPCRCKLIIEKEG